MGSRGASSALVNGRVVLVLRRATGVSELGVILDVSVSAFDTSSSEFGGRRIGGVGSGFDAGAARGGGGGGGGGGGRKRTVLSLFRPSPLDEKNHSAASAGAPMMMLKKKDDTDDMFLGMKAIGKGKGGGGGEVPSSDIIGICKVKIRVDADAIATGDAAATAAAVNALIQVQEDAAAGATDTGVGKSNTATLSGGDPPLMDPISDLKINSIEVAVKRLLIARMAALARQSGDAGLAQLPEFHQRVNVLQQMGYLDSDRTVAMKGRVACEINSGDELVATELIFGGVLTDLSPEEAVSLLSALVFQEKSEVEPELPPKLIKAREESAVLAYSAGVVQQEAGLSLIPEDYVKSTLNFGLMEVVYEWAQGTPFNEICRLTDVMEGSIVRTIVRLDETCREFRDAARVMGNIALFQQMQEASEAIKRDIVFAASLYVA
ncbi:hypothetical protein Ndes2437A_g09018 [Nannochloris sp. 'desiccata']